MELPKIGEPEWVRLVQEKVATLKNSRPLTDEEMRRLTYICKTRNLDPLLNHIHCMFYKDKATDNRTVSFHTSIDAFRLTAARSGSYAGSDEPKFAEKDGKIISCTVSVYRMVAGQRCPFVAIAYLSEYYPHELFAKSTLWPKMPHTMLSKVAEALALRKGFPEELSGLYVEEEMDQRQTNPADNDPTYLELQTAMKNAGVPGKVFAAYLHDQHQVSKFSELPPAAQTIALDALKAGIVTEWSKGLLENVSALARSKGITPAQLADECAKRFNEPAIGKITHTQRMELAEAIAKGEIVPAPQPEQKKPEPPAQTDDVKEVRGTISGFTQSGDVVRVLIRSGDTDCPIFFRASDPPPGMPKEEQQRQAMKNAGVVATFMLKPSKSDPQTKMRVLHSIKPLSVEQEKVTARVESVARENDNESLVTLVGHRERPEIVIARKPLAAVQPWIGKNFVFTLRTTTAELRLIANVEEDDIPSKAEDFRGHPQPQPERVQVKVFAVAPGNTDTPNQQPVAMVEFADKRTEQVTFGSQYTADNAKGLEGATVLFDLQPTQPLRTVVRVEVVAPPQPKGVNPEFRAEMEKRRQERKLQERDPASPDALQALALSNIIPLACLNDFCEAEWGMGLDDIPEEERDALRHKLQNGEVKKYYAEWAAILSESREPPAATA